MSEAVLSDVFAHVSTYFEGNISSFVNKFSVCFVVVVAGVGAVVFELNSFDKYIMFPIQF